MGVGEQARVAVLMGGISSEHNVSVCTGLNVLDALPKCGYRGTSIYLDRGGGWHFDHRPEAPELGPDDSVAASPAPLSAISADIGVFERLATRQDADVVFIALHGPGGEDGTVQGLLRVADIPFTGSGVLSSALAMDKILSKQILGAAGLPVADHVVAEHPDILQADSFQRSVAALGYPCVVKPAAGGSSFATSVVGDDDELDAAVRRSLRDGGVTMVERFVAGIEVTCGVLGGGAEPISALPVTEIAPVAKGFFDFRAKYTVGACEEITPARIDPAATLEVQRLAVSAHELLRCEGCSRSDFIVSDDGIRVLELNTIPGMTETSLLPQGALAAGIEFPELVDRLVRSALLRRP